jgi:hypothetical protein
MGQRRVPLKSVEMWRLPSVYALCSVVHAEVVMLRILGALCLVLGLAAVVVVVWPRNGDLPAAGAADSLEGVWTITSVVRDGEPDPLQVGELMTFSADRVMFHAKVPQFANALS